MTMADFSKAWRVVKIRGFEYHPQDDVGCCGVIVSQAVKDSWNYCPYCGEAVPEGVKELYDHRMP